MRTGNRARERCAHAHDFLAIKDKPNVIKRKPLLIEPKPLLIALLPTDVLFLNPVDNDLLPIRRLVVVSEVTSTRITDTNKSPTVYLYLLSKCASCPYENFYLVHAKDEVPSTRVRLAIVFHPSLSSLTTLAILIHQQAFAGLT